MNFETRQELNGGCGAPILTIEDFLLLGSKRMEERSVKVDSLQVVLDLDVQEFVDNREPQTTCLGIIGRVIEIDPHVDPTNGLKVII